MSVLKTVNLEGVSIASEALLASYASAGPAPTFVAVRARLGSVARPLDPDGGSYRVWAESDGAEIPADPVAKSSGSDMLQVQLAAVILLQGEALDVRAVGQGGDLAVDIRVDFVDATPAGDEAVVGDGSVLVDHNYGGPDELAIKDCNGLGIADVRIRFYTMADWLAGMTGNSRWLDEALTDDDGRWKRKVAVNPGQYHLVYYLPGRSAYQRGTVLREYDLTVL